MGHLNVLAGHTRYLYPVGNLVLALLLIVSQLLAFAPTAWADTGTWVDGSFPVLSIGGQVPAPTPVIDCIPSTFMYWSYTKIDGSFDSIGRSINTSVCASQNLLGSYGSAGTSDDYEYVMPNTAYAFRVFNALGNGFAVTPVPHQAVFMTKDSSQSFNGEVAPHYYDNFLSAGTFGSAYGQLALTVNKTGAVLTDSTGAKIYMHAYAFSRNGQWMVIEARGLGLIRVNTQTRAMQLFDQTKLSYGLGFHPQMTLAISDDGNSVIKSGKDASDTFAYDLSGCQPGSFATGNSDNSSAMQGCGKRALQSSLGSQMSGFAFLANMQFSSDGKSISAVAAQAGLNGVTTYYAAAYNVAGYQAPHLSYLALGDSFSSGEGAYDYEPGTNDADNICHLSRHGYPYIAASIIGYSDFHSVACSGASRSDYETGQKGQNKTPSSSLGDWIPGYQGQGKYLNMGGKTSVVTISMGGNDIDFSGKIKYCLLPHDSCFHFQDDRRSIAEEIYKLFDDKLVPLYRAIKTDSGNKDTVKVYVLGYPQILGTGPACELNVPLDQEERQMAQGMVSYLNAVIKAATIKSGVQYIDVEHTFDGHRLCEDGSKAVNGLTIDTSVPGLPNIANSSFHPNVLGHQLLGQALLVQSQNFTTPMPVADSSQQAPYTSSLEYANFVNSAPLGGTLSHLIYEGAGVTNIAVRGSNIPLTVTDRLLKQNSPFQVWFHSTPTLAGTLISDAQGQLSGQITVPTSLASGYHTVDIVGKDMSGQDIDMYRTIYVAASADDYNGDGVPNSSDPCQLVVASGIDKDKDGIDDACDLEITPPSADTVPPVVAGTADRQPDANGWYNHDVNIAWSATDHDPSSGTPTQPAVTVANREGEQSYASEPSCDLAGNCASGSLMLKLDKTAPDITYAISPAPNTFGWSKSAVTVTFRCQDEMSGIASCPEPVRVSGDHDSYIVTGTVADNAGNTNSVNAIISLDSTPPSVSQAVSPAPNGAGWNNTDVTITSVCSDALSGIALCDSPAVITTEGAGQIFASSAIDRAANTATSIVRVNIDKTAPDITFTVDPAHNGSGWNNTSASVHFICTDVVSGVASCSDPVTITSDGTYLITGTVKDNAGNTAGVNAVVSIDATPPTVTNILSRAANGNGWYNDDVTILPTCSDVLSGVASCSQPVTLASEGANQIITSNAVDNAGNSASAVSTINIDKTSPTVDSLQWLGNPKSTLGYATLTVRASDNLSGAVRGEYYLGDVDPGLGKGAMLTAANGNFVTIFGADFPTGVYKVSARVQDAAGNWSAATSEYLVVYDPFNVRMSGKKFVVLSAANGDTMPWLTAASLIMAKFGFSVGYDAQGRLMPNNDLQLSYSVGANCNNASRAQNCHAVSINANSVVWFTTQGINNSTGIFEGSGTMTVDGIQQPVKFILTGLDGERLNLTSPDHLQLQIFAPGANSSSAQPLYRLDEPVARGNIHIKV